MTDPAGGFYSTEDADSEGHEGLFYTWTPDEIEAVLGEERGATFGRVYDVSDVGNFEGRNILNLPKTLEQCAAILSREPDELAAELAESREKLFAAREKRVRPGRDDKVIVAWNGLMIDAMARAGAALERTRVRHHGRRSGRASSSARMRRDDGRLLHTWRDGSAKLDAYLDDYASLANSLVSLYEANFNERWIDEAVQLMDIVLEKFADPAGGGFFYTAADHEQLITRTKELTDSSTPSGNALAATALLRLGKLLGRSDYLDAAERTLAAAVPDHAARPDGRRPDAARARPLPRAGARAGARRRHGTRRYEGRDRRDSSPLSAAVACSPRAIPRRPTQTPRARQHLDELFAGKESPDGQPVLYVCQNFACQAPAVGLDGDRIAARLAQLERIVDKVAPLMPLSQLSCPFSIDTPAARAAITSASGTPCASAIRGMPRTPA